MENFIEKRKAEILVAIIFVAFVSLVIGLAKWVYSECCNSNKIVNSECSKNNTDENMLVINGRTEISINDYFYQEMPKLLNEKYTKFESKDLIKLPAAVKLANVQKSIVIKKKAFESVPPKIKLGEYSKLVDDLMPAREYVLSEFQPTKDPLDFLYSFDGGISNGHILVKSKNSYVFFKGSWYVENEYKKVITKQDAIKELNSLIRSFNGAYDDEKAKEDSWKEK